MNPTTEALPGPQGISAGATPIFRREWFPLFIARIASVTFAMIGFVVGFALAQSQSLPDTSTPSAASQPQPTAAPVVPQPRRVVVPTVTDVAKADKAAAGAGQLERVYTNSDVEALPPGGVSIVGAPASQTPAKPKPAAADDTAQKAAYWKARFVAARHKLAADKKSLPEIQRQFEMERVQENIGDPDTGQLYSDTHMELLREISATQTAIQNDQKALKDLHQEFRDAKGNPNWIR